MPILRAIVFSAALAGLIVGVIVTVAQQFGTVPLILQSEVYEQAAEKAELEKAATQQAMAGHQHAEADHQHAAAAEPWEPANGLERNAYTALFNIIDWIGFGLIMTSAFVLLRRPITWREGFLWGLAGFAIFMVAPSLGLPPELPGVPAADLEPRQLWWVGTVMATAAALGLIAFTRSPLGAIAAVALIAAPHLIGAPHLDQVETNVPETLSHQFVVMVTLTTLLSWTLLGSLTGYFYRRFSI